MTVSPCPPALYSTNWTGLQPLRCGSSLCAAVISTWEPRLNQVRIDDSEIFSIERQRMEEIDTFRSQKCTDKPPQLRHTPPLHAVVSKDLAELMHLLHWHITSVPAVTAVNKVVIVSDMCYTWKNLCVPMTARYSSRCRGRSEYWWTWHPDDTENLPLRWCSIHEHHIGGTSYQGDHQRIQEYQYTHHHSWTGQRWWCRVR